jgi:hypothetical protein
LTKIKDTKKSGKWEKLVRTEKRKVSKSWAKDKWKKETEKLIGTKKSEHLAKKKQATKQQKEVNKRLKTEEKKIIKQIREEEKAKKVKKKNTKKTTKPVAKKATSDTMNIYVG